MAARPTIVVIGGPNGAGKTTISREVLENTLGVREFVNADAIAAGLSGFNPERAAFAAGRVMLARLHELAANRPQVSFAFESTLASRTFAPWLSRQIASGWQVHVLYLWLQSPALAIRRVKARVRAGGHSIPEAVIRRRYARSAANFWHLYRPLAASWRMMNNSGAEPELIAAGEGEAARTIYAPRTYAAFMELTNADPQCSPDSADDS